MTTHQAKIIDVSTGQILFSCPLEQIELAYHEASQYEDFGLDVKIIAPTLTETLANSLGIDGDILRDYQDSVIAEIHDHEGCCNKED